MTTILENWIAKITGLRVSLAPEQAGRSLYDGQIFREILTSYNAIDVEQCPAFLPAHDDPQTAIVNLLSLSPWLRLLGLNQSTNTLRAIAEKDDTAGLHLLFQLYSVLENTGGTFLTSEAEVRLSRPGVGSRGQGESHRFQVTGVSENEGKSLPALPEYFYLEEPLRGQGDACQRYRNYREKVIGNSKEAMKKRRQKLAAYFPENEPLVPGPQPTLPRKPLAYQIDDFEKLLTVIPGEEQDFTVTPDGYVKYLKTRRSKSNKTTAYESKMKKKLMNDLGQDTDRKEDQEFQGLLQKILLRECQYEKKLKSRLLKLHGTYNHLIDIEERVNKLSVEASVKLVDEKKLTRMATLQRQERRIRELHTRIWEARQRAIKDEASTIASSTLEDLIDFAAKFSEYKNAFNTLPDPKLYREWKELFFKNFPLLREPRSFVEAGEVQDEPVDDIMDQNKITQTVSSEIQCMDDEECGLDLAIIDCLNNFNMKTYLNLENEWKLTAESTPEKFRLIGNIAHRLLHHKYPFPSLPPRDSIPQFKLKILLGSFQDQGAQQIFTRLSEYLAKSKVELFDVNMAINFCLNAYFREKNLIPPGDMIKTSFIENEIKRRADIRNEMRDRFPRRLTREPETIFKALVFTTGDDDQILVGGHEGRHKATQVPSVMDLSQPTTSGRLGKMAFEILSTGRKLNDVLICCMIVEFLRSLTDRTGFVIVNYPKSMFQAYLLELIMKGVSLKAPGTSTADDESRLIEELRVIADFNAVKEKCLENTINFFPDPAKKKRKPQEEVVDKEKPSEEKKKSIGRKSVARKSMKRKSVSRKSVSRKSVARKSVARKSVAKGQRKSVAKGQRKSVARKSVARKSVAKGQRKSVARKSVAKGQRKTLARKSVVKGSKDSASRKAPTEKSVEEEEAEEEQEPPDLNKSNQTQLVRRALDFDQLLKLRDSEIVPKITCSTPPFASRPFFDKYIKFFKATCNTQESQFLEPLALTPARTIYERFDLVETFDYARFDSVTEKRLARVILDEPWDESDLQRKTSYFLFGKDVVDHTVNTVDVVLSSSASSDSSKESLTQRAKRKKEVVVKYRKYDPVKPIRKIKKPEPEPVKPVEESEEEEHDKKKGKKEKSKKSPSRKSVSRKSVARKSMKRKSVARKSVSKGSRKSVSRKSVSRKSVARKSVARKSMKRKSVARKSVSKGSRKSLARKSVSKGPRKSTMQRGSFYRETTSKGGQRPPPRVLAPKIDPNDPNWVLLCEPIEDHVSHNAANMWETMEYVYLTNSEKVFYLLREHDKKVLPHLTELTQELNTNLCKDNVVKQHLVTNLQLALNSIEQEFRRDPDLKSEFHYRVDELKRTLSGFTFDNLQRLNVHRLDVISKNWTSEHLSVTSDLYLALVQNELDRFVDTLQVIADYYFSMAQAVPETKRFDRITVKRLAELGQESEVKTIFEAMRKLLAGEFTEENDGTEEEEEIEEPDFANPAHGFITTPIAAIISSLESLSNECKSLTDHNDFEKGLRGKTRQITVEENPGQPDSTKNTFEYEILDDAKREWTSSVDNELARVKFRLNLIQNRAKTHMDQVVKQFKQVFDGFQRASEQRAIREWAAESDMTYVFQRAIEEETGIQPLMVMDGDKFYVNREILLYPDPPPPPPTALEETITDYSFTIAQLYSLVSKFKLMAPLGMLDVPLVQVIHEMVMSGVESGRQCLPLTWSRLTGVDLRNMFSRAFGDQTWIDWRDFVIYCSRITYPTIEELIEVHSKYREVDKDRSEQISFNDFFPIMLWFEKDFGATLKDDLRATLAKELIFEMFKTDDDTINYTDMCLAWCKGEQPEDGLVMALELYKDSGFLLPPEVCYRDDEMGDIHPRKIVDWWMNIFMNDMLTETETMYLKRLEKMTNLEVYASEENQFEISEDILKAGKGRKFDDISSSEEDELVPKKSVIDYLKDDEEVEAKYTLPMWNRCVPFELSLALICRALYMATSPIHHHQILGIEERLGLLYKEKGVGNYLKAHVLGRSDIFKEFVSKTNIFKQCDILSVAEEIIKAKPPVEPPPEK